MSDGPRIVAADAKWRIVRAEDGNSVRYVLEKHDGCDALGCERWRELNVGSSSDTITRQLRDWIIQHALKCEQMKETTNAG